MYIFCFLKQRHDTLNTDFMCYFKESGTMCLAQKTKWGQLWDIFVVSGKITRKKHEMKWAVSWKKKKNGSLPLQKQSLRPADQCFVFATRIVQSLFFLNPKFQASSFHLWHYMPVCVRLGWKSRRPFFFFLFFVFLSRLKWGYEVLTYCGAFIEHAWWPWQHFCHNIPFIGMTIELATPEMLFEPCDK